MTLVVCKKTSDRSGIVIHSDSKITDEYGTGLEQDLRQASPLSGLLKTIILNPHVCLSFAGSSSYATNFLKDFYLHPEKAWSTQKLLDYLLKMHTDTQQAIDFIVCTSFQKTPQIYSIKNGELLSDQESTWIGSHDAFRLFQGQFLADTTSTIEDRTNSAFQYVIDSNEVPDVGHFHIEVNTNLKAVLGETVFLYKIGLAMNPGPQVIHLKANQAKALPTGTAQDGSYGLSYLRSYSSQIHGIAIHFPHGEFGILFCPKIDCEKGILITKVDGRSFAEEVQKKYGFPLQGFIIEKNGFVLIDQTSK